MYYSNEIDSIDYFNAINKIMKNFQKTRIVQPISSGSLCQKIIHEVVLLAEYIIKEKKIEYIQEMTKNEWSIPLQLAVDKIKKNLNINNNKDNTINTSLQEILCNYCSGKYLKIDSDTKEKITKEICG